MKKESYIVKGLLIEETYKNIYLAGNITPEENKKILQSIKIPISWNTNALAISNESFFNRQENYEPFIVYLWIEGSFSVNDPKNEFCGSELVIVFTITNLINTRVSELLTIALNHVKWDHFAKNITM